MSTNNPSRFDTLVESATPEKEDQPKKEYLGLTEKQFNRFARACNQTYQHIGHDLGDQPKSRNELIEVICDADYIRMFGEYDPPRKSKDGEQPWKEFYAEVVEPFLRKNYGSKPFMAMMKKVFPFSTYE